MLRLREERLTILNRHVHAILKGLTDWSMCLLHTPVYFVELRYNGLLLSMCLGCLLFPRHLFLLRFDTFASTLFLCQFWYVCFNLRQINHLWKVLLSNQSHSIGTACTLPATHYYVIECLAFSYWFTYWNTLACTYYVHVSLLLVRYLSKW